MKKFFIILIFLAILTFTISYNLENKYNITGQVFRTLDLEQPTIDSCASQNQGLENNKIYDLTLNVNAENICINLTNKNNITIDLKSHTIIGKQNYPTIYLDNCQNITFLGGKITNSSNAIHIKNSEEINFMNTIIENTSIEGIKLENSEEINLTNIIYDNKNLGDLTKLNNWDEISPIDVGTLSSISISSDGQKILISSKNGKVYLSENFGQTWNEKQTIGDWVATAMNSNGSTMLLAKNGSSIYLSTDSGSTWSTPSITNTINSNWAAIGVAKQVNTIIALEKSGQVYKYNGTHFNNVTNETKDWRDLTITGLHNLIFAVAYNDKIYKSTNSGDTFENITNESKNWYTISMSFDGSKIIAGENPGRLWYSNNTGINWYELKPAGDVNMNWETTSISEDGNKILAGSGTNNARIYLSEDSGKTWTEMQPLGDTDQNWKASAVSNKSNIYLGIQDGSIYQYSKKGIIIENTNSSLIKDNTISNIDQAIKLTGSSNQNIIENLKTQNTIYSIKDLTTLSYQNYLKFSNEYGNFIWANDSINQDLTTTKQFNILNPQQMKISQNNIYVNDTYYNLLNESINITFYRTDDWQDYIFILKSSETCMPDCIERFRNVENISFKTTSLGNYSINGPIEINSCQSQYFFKDYRVYTLSQNIDNFNSAQNCFMIEDNNNITLDLKGHFVRSTHLSAGSGILILRSEGINIKNGELINFTQGIKIENSKDSLIENVTLKQGRKYGINLFDTNSNTENNILSNLNFEDNKEFSIFDETQITDLNYLIYNNSYGTVEWANNNLYQNLSFENNLTKEKNILIKPSNIFLNFTNVDEKINSTINLTFYNVGTDNYKRNNETCLICNDIAVGLEIATIKFNTTNDGNYTVEEIGYINQCGYSNWFNGGKYIINQSIESEGDLCFNITNNNVLLDLNNTIINSTIPQTNNGIRTNKTNITIKNGILKNFNESIKIENATNIYLQNITFNNNSNDLIINNSTNITLKDSHFQNTFNKIIYSTKSVLLDITKIKIDSFLGDSKNIIDLNQVINSSISQINFTDNRTGNTFLYLEQVNNTIIEKINLENISLIGINIKESNENHIKEINITEKEFDQTTAIKLNQSNENLIESIKIENVEYNFNISNSEKNLFKDINLINPKRIGIFLLNSINNTLNNTIITNNLENENTGIVLYNSSYNNLNSTNINNLSVSIKLETNSQNNQIKNLNSISKENSIIDNSGLDKQNYFYYENIYGKINWINETFLKDLSLEEDITFPGIISLGELQANISSSILKLNTTMEILLKNTKGYTELFHFNLTRNNIEDTESEIKSLDTNEIIFNTTTSGNYLIKDTIVDTSIESCQEIIHPNKIYQIMNNINSEEEKCLILNANNITILGNNKRINGTNGIAIYVNASNITIQDFYLIENFETAIYISPNVKNTLIKNLYTNNVSYSILDESLDENKNNITYESSYSKIKWLDEDLSQDLTITNEIQRGNDISLNENYIFLNNTKLSKLNRQSKIIFSLWNNEVLNLNILKNGSTCSSSICLGVENDNNNLILDVNEWGNISFSGCGDRIINGDEEECEASDFIDDKTCYDYGFNSGSLSCFDNCTIDISDCELVETITPPSSGGSTGTTTNTTTPTTGTNTTTPTTGTNNQPSSGENLENPNSLNLSLIIGISIGILILITLSLVIIYTKKKSKNKNNTQKNNTQNIQRKPIVLSPPKAPQIMKTVNQKNMTNNQLPRNNIPRNRIPPRNPLPPQIQNKINEMPKPKPIIEEKKELTNEEFKKNKENDIKVKQKIKELLLNGLNQIKSRDINQAIETYKKINIEYQNMSEHNDAVYDTVVEFYKRIRDLKE